MPVPVWVLVFGSVVSACIHCNIVCAPQIKTLIESKTLKLSLVYCASFPSLPSSENGFMFIFQRSQRQSRQVRFCWCIVIWVQLPEHCCPFSRKPISALNPFRLTKFKWWYHFVWSNIHLSYGWWFAVLTYTISMSLCKMGACFCFWTQYFSFVAVDLWVLALFVSFRYFWLVCGIPVLEATHLTF